MGSDHLSPANIHDEGKDYSSVRAYGRGVVEEANSWSTRTRHFADEPISATSDVASSESTGGTSSDSSPRSGDLSNYFRFSKNDVLLIVDDSKFAVVTERNSRDSLGLDYDMRKFIKTM